MTEAARRILLVGFMGSGKSTVGPELARALGWTFLDVDQLVEAERGRSVAEIFAELGEDVFRADEAELTERCLRRDRVVVASGGGWPATEGRMEGTPEGTLTVWLRVTPEEAVRRALSASGERPLLDVPEPIEEAEKLLSARVDFYQRADVEVDTNGHTVDDVSALILERITLHNPRSQAE